LKISGKYDHNEDFLKQTLTTFKPNKEEFQDSYINFLENLDFTVDDYKKKIAVSKIHHEFKETLELTLNEFLKISGKNMDCWMLFP